MFDWNWPTETQITHLFAVLYGLYVIVSFSKQLSAIAHLLERQNEILMGIWERTPH